MHLRDMAEGRADLFKIDPRRLKVDPGYNVRLEGPDLRAHVDALKISIKTIGQTTPYVVRKDEEDNIFIVAGHCRNMAVMELIAEGVDIKTVLCMSEERGTSVADRDVHLLASNLHMPLPPLEKGAVLKRLRTLHGWSDEDLRAKSGLSDKQIDNLIGLQAVNPETKELISTGVVAATEVIKAVKTEGLAAAQETIKAAAQIAAPTGRKVTAKTIEQARAKTAETAPEKIETPDTGTIQVPRIVNTPAKFKELVDSLKTILEMDDINAIKTVVRDTLGVRNNKKAA